MQVFQYWKLIVQKRDKPLQIQNRDFQADAANTITVSECKHDSLFIVRGEVLIFIAVINDERKSRPMRQHVCHWRATCTKEAKAQMEG